MLIFLIAIRSLTHSQALIDVKMPVHIRAWGNFQILPALSEIIMAVKLFEVWGYFDVIQKLLLFSTSKYYQTLQNQFL